MSVEANKAFIRRFNEEIWRGNQAIFDEGYASDAVIRRADSVESMREGLNSVRAALSDVTFTINELVGEEDKVVARWTLNAVHTGRHPGILEGAEPANKQVTFTGISMYRIADGKIVDDWYEVSNN